MKRLSPVAGMKVGVNAFFSVYGTGRDGEDVTGNAVQLESVPDVSSLQPDDPQYADFWQVNYTPTSNGSLLNQESRDDDPSNATAEGLLEVIDQSGPTQPSVGASKAQQRLGEGLSTSTPITYPPPNGLVIDPFSAYGTISGATVTGGTVGTYAGTVILDGSNGNWQINFDGVPADKYTLTVNLS